MMAGVRTYGQNCGLARGLDLLGERWTLLILRELARGPKRFRDLMAGLDGIGTNLLSARLASLQEAGVITSEPLPAPAGVSAYALTPSGRELLPLLDGLALWGLQLPWPGADEGRNRVAWAAMTMRANAERAGTVPPDGVYDFRIGEERFWLQVANGRIVLTDGASPVAADVSVSAEPVVFLRVATGREGPDVLTVTGDEARLRELMRTFRFPQDAAPPVPALVDAA